MTSNMISANGVSSILGRNSPPLHVFTSAIFVMVLFFYIFSIGSYLQADISPFENRINYHKAFLNYVIDKDIDHAVIIFGASTWLFLSLSSRMKILIMGIYVGAAIIAMTGAPTMLDTLVLLSLPIMLLLIIYDSFAPSKILKTNTNLYINYSVIFLTALTTLSLIVSLEPLLSLQSDKPATYDYAYFIFLLLSSISPVLIFFLILGSPIKLLTEKIITKLKIRQKLEPLSEQKSNNTILYLVIILLLAATLSLIPHNPIINTDNQEVSADSGDYVTMMRSMQSAKNTQELIQQAFVTIQGGDRPFTLVFLYVIAQIVPADLSYTIDHLPIILTPLLVLSVFFLTREITLNDKASLFAAFLTAVSFQTLIGVYGGLFANLFSLVIGYFSFVFLIRFLKKSNKTNLLVFALLMISFVYSHVYTWTILTLVMSVFLIIMYKMNYYDRKIIVVAFLVILLTITIDVSRSLITNAHGGITGDTDLASSGASVSHLLLSWNTLTDTMGNYAGGQLGDFIIFILAIYWLFQTNLRNPLGIFLTVFISIGALPLLFGNGVIQSRVFYDIPFQIPAAIGLTYMSKRKMGGTIVVLPICMWLVAISLRMVTNFYYLPP